MTLQVVRMKANRIVVEVQRGERAVDDAMLRLGQLDESFYRANPDAEPDGDSTFICADAAERVQTIANNRIAAAAKINS